MLEPANFPFGEDQESAAMSLVLIFSILVLFELKQIVTAVPRVARHGGLKPTNSADEIFGAPL
jgi:hypothetical protein